MLFRKKKRKENKKEFIQYKDGKIVSVEVDLPEKPENLKLKEEIPLYQELPTEEDIQEEKLRDKLKRSITPKHIKGAVAVIILILFLFTLVDLYQAFFQTSDESGKQPDTKTEESYNQNMNLPSLNDPSSKTPPSQTNNPPSSDEEAEGTITQIPLQQALDIANTSNHILISESSAEINYVHSYLDRKANLRGLNNQLADSLKEKENMYITLSVSEPVFIQADAKELHEKTKERLSASISFTKQVQEIVNQGTAKSSLSPFIDEYVSTDNDLQKEQLSALISAFEKNDISYQYDQEKNFIQYTL